MGVGERRRAGRLRERIAEPTAQRALKRLPAKELVTLILKLIHNGRKRGIQQGGPLSPLLLNEYLDHFLDKPWEKAAVAIPLLRYVDDLLALCKTKKEARDACAIARAVASSRHATQRGRSHSRFAQVAGRRLAWLLASPRRRALDVRIAEKAWSRLNGALMRAHERRCAAKGDGDHQRMGGSNRPQLQVRESA